MIAQGKSIVEFENTACDKKKLIAQGKSIGRWTNTACDKKNVVVCQKMHNWTGGRLQKEFSDMKIKIKLQHSKI